MALCIFRSFLLLSLALLGMGMSKAGLRPSLPSNLDDDWSHVRHFFSSILDAWRFRDICQGQLRGRAFRGVQFADFQGIFTTTYLVPT